MDSDTKLENPSAVIEGLNSESTPTTYVDNHDQSPSPAPPSSSTRHSKKPSDPSMLNPVTLKSDRRWSVEASADEDPFQPTPPPPTLSTQSPFHFMSLTALRQNTPHDGTSSLALPNPRDNSHARRPLNATTTADDATVDHRITIIHPPASHVITSAHTSLPSTTIISSAPNYPTRVLHVLCQQTYPQPPQNGRRLNLSTSKLPLEQPDAPCPPSDKK